MADAGTLCLTFDNMGRAREIAEGTASKPDALEPGLAIGYPRLLGLLDELSLRGTFFIEGWNGLHHPERVQELAGRGHEVGLHGWVHEKFGALDKLRAEQLLHDGTASLTRLGIRPEGFRAPGALRGPHTADILRSSPTATTAAPTSQRTLPARTTTPLRPDCSPSASWRNNPGASWRNNTREEPMSRLLLSLVLAMAAAAVQAQAWPAKPVRVVVAFAPGGSLDFVTRILSERLSQDLGQTFLVENRAGANGNVGADIVAKLPGDGYVILASADALPSSAHLYKLSFDPMKDLVPVIQFTRQPLVLAVHPSLNVGTVAELIALAKTKPGMGFATSGAGSGQHMAGEWLAKLSGVKLTHVPYKGGGQAITDLLAGQVQIGSLGSTPVIPHHKSGKLKIIAQSTATRSPSLPEVPTYQEAGVPILLDQWLGFLVPAGTPPDIVKRLNAATDKILAQPAIRERFAPQGLEAVGGSPEQFARLYRDDYEKYGRLVKELNIRID